MKRRSLGSLLILLSLAGAAAANTGSRSWRPVPTPNQGPLSNGLNAVAVSPAGDAWAVGHWYDNSLASYRSLAMRWSGSQWVTTPSPNAGNGYNDLLGVSALSASDAWAVGYSRASQYNPMRTLVLHWTGGAWQTVPSPNPGTADNTLYAVHAVSANDVWAAGWYYDSQLHGQPLLLHWNGTQWSQVAAPAASATYNVLQGLGGTASDDLWAVGRAYQDGKYVTLTMHWDGAAWSLVASPSVSGRSNQLKAVTAIAPDDAWAVGDAQGTALLLHWNGVGWTAVAGAEPAANYNTLWAVASRGGSAVWAVGYTTDSGGTIAPLIERWDGERWVVQPISAAGMMPALFGAASGASSMWVVGIQSNGAADRTLSLSTMQ